MRALSPELAARLDADEARTCHVWLLTRRDGVRLGFTDHDCDLHQDGVACRADAGWTAGAADRPLGLGPGHAAAQGGLDHEVLMAEDLTAGLYDGAAVECRLVDWTRPDLFVVLWSARIKAVRWSGEGFQADLEGPLAALDRVVGRTFGRLCDADLGDERCGVPAGHPAFAQGCDKRASTCRTRFSNLDAFRGFPAMPGDDFVTVYPGEGERHDGGSRNA
jgi:hypothetical protein